MSIFPSEIFTRGSALLGFNDDYKSSLLGRKFAGFPKGVYVGFNPSVSPPSPILTLSISPVEGVSLIKIPSNADAAGLDIIVDQIVTLDFTGQLVTDFPIHVVARATYTDDPDTPTTAELFTRSSTVVGQLLTAIGGTPVNIDLSLLSIVAPTRLRQGTVQITVDVDGIGSTSVTDDGNGVFPASLALPLGGTIDYLTGALTGITPTLAVGSFVVADYTLSSIHSEVIICEVGGDPNSLTVVSEPSLGQSDAPIALAGIDFGFMPAGSVENLESAVDFVNEVVAARVGLDSVIYDSLSDRLVADQSAAAMANRLALVFKVLRSNDVSVLDEEIEVNVSGSFSEIDREHAPVVTIGGLGSESTTGAVSDPNDADRNVCVIVDAITGERPIDDATTRRVIFGRLTGPEENPIGGELSFTNASRNVTSDGDLIGSSLLTGDILQGPDGLFYEVETIVSAALLTLKNAYTGPTAAAESLTSRRWLLKFKTMVGTTETEVEFPGNATLRFFFPIFLDMSTSNFDYRLAMHTSGEPEPLPIATTAIPGKMLLATDGSVLGAMKIQGLGVDVAGGLFHALNFTAPAAQVIAGTIDGEVEVVEIGQPGPPGPAGQTGQPGPAGGEGEGFEAINTFEILPETADQGGGSMNPFSFTRDMGHEIRIFGIGIASWRDEGGFNNNTTVDVIEINSAILPTPTSVQIDGTINGDTLATLFITSAGVVSL